MREFVIFLLGLFGGAGLVWALYAKLRAYVSELEAAVKNAVVQAETYAAKEKSVAHDAIAELKAKFWHLF